MQGRGVKQTVLLALVTLAGSLHPRNAFKGNYDMPAHGVLMIDERSRF